jgi:hypothetical protein
MSPLATEIYKQLVRMLKKQKHSTTYGELATEVSRKIPTHRRSAKLHAALGEVTEACRAADLPCLPAIVWRAGSNRPSDGYYKLAHPRARTDEARVTAWEREHARVVDHADRFPASPPASPPVGGS